MAEKAYQSFREAGLRAEQAADSRSAYFATTVLALATSLAANRGNE